MPKSEKKKDDDDVVVENKTGNPVSSKEEAMRIIGEKEEDKNAMMSLFSDVNPNDPLRPIFAPLGKAKRKERREGDVPESERSVAQAFAVERTLDGAVYAGDETDENRHAHEFKAEESGIENNRPDGGRVGVAKIGGFYTGVCFGI